MRQFGEKSGPGTASGTVSVIIPGTVAISRITERARIGTHTPSLVPPDLPACPVLHDLPQEKGAWIQVPPPALDPWGITGQVVFLLTIPRGRADDPACRKKLRTSPGCRKPSGCSLAVCRKIRKCW
jgi:hypothetical protein